MPYTILYICHIHIHYTYVTNLHKHIWHTPNNMLYVTCMCIHTSSETQPNSQTDVDLGRKLGFWAWYTCTCTAYIQIQRWHMYTSEIWCPISYMYMYICYLHTLTYVTYINIHMWKIHICMRMSYIRGMYYCTWHMYMCICTYVTYMHIYKCYLHTHYICYLHIYPTYIHIWAICI